MITQNYKPGDTITIYARAGNSHVAFKVLITEVLPHGVRGNYSTFCDQVFEDGLFEYALYIFPHDEHEAVTCLRQLLAIKGIQHDLTPEEQAVWAKAQYLVDLHGVFPSLETNTADTIFSDALCAG